MTTLAEVKPMRYDETTDVGRVLGVLSRMRAVLSRSVESRLSPEEESEMDCLSKDLYAAFGIEDIDVFLAVQQASRNAAEEDPLDLGLDPKDEESVSCPRCGQPHRCSP